MHSNVCVMVQFPNWGNSNDNYKIVIKNPRNLARHKFYFTFTVFNIKVHTAVFTKTLALHLRLYTRIFVGLVRIA